MTTKLTLEIEINGGSRVTCESLRLVCKTLTLQNLSADTLVMTQIRRLGDAPALAYEDEIALFKNGVCCFRGQVLEPSYSYDDKSISTTYTAHNWWRQFTRLIYTYSLFGYKQIGDTATLFGAPVQFGWDYDFGTTPDTVPLTLQTSAKTLAFPVRAGAPFQDTLKVEIEKYFAYVLERHPGLFAAVSLPFGSTALPRTRVIQDQLVSDLLVQAMTMIPAGAFRTDYSATTPVISAVDADTLTPTEFAIGSTPLRALQFQPAYDMRPKGVLLRFGVQNFNASILDGWVDLDPTYLWKAYPFETRMDEPNVLGMSLQNDDANYMPLTTVAELAEWLFNQMDPLRGRGSCVFDDYAMTLGLRPGDRLAFTGDHPSIEHGALILQSTVHDFGRGLTSCTLGVPRALTMDELKDRNGWFNRAFQGWIRQRPTAIPFS